MIDPVVLDLINERLDRMEDKFYLKTDRIEVKVDELLAFKWKGVGGIMVFNFILMATIGVATIYFSRGG